MITPHAEPPRATLDEGPPSSPSVQPPSDPAPTRPVPARLPGASEPPSAPPGAPPDRPGGSVPSPSTGRGDGGRSRESPRPTPARPQEASRARGPVPLVEVRSRALEFGGERWIVRESGRTSSGTGGDARAPLLHLVFIRAADPERPARELLACGHTIDDLTDDELAGLFARARPYRDREGRREVFPDTRKKGGKGI